VSRPTFDALGANAAVPPTVVTIAQFRLSSSPSQACNVMVTGVSGEALTVVWGQTFVVGVDVGVGVGVGVGVLVGVRPGVRTGVVGVGVGVGVGVAVAVGVGVGVGPRRR